MKINFFIVMGVSGCGKSSLGMLLAERLGWELHDADDFHPQANLEKMAKGLPLNDSDRAPWLTSLHDLIYSSLKVGQPGVLACSALKERYRQQLMAGNDGVQLVYLKGSYELIWSRMTARKEHFMKPEMLKSQFETLEEPLNAIIVDISMPMDEILKKIIETMQ